MQEMGLVRQVNAGSYLYMKKSNRTGSGRVLAKSVFGAQVTVSVAATEEAANFDTTRFFSPVVITSSNNRINFKSASGGSQFTGVVDVGTYYDPKSLAYAVERAMTIADPTGNHEFRVTWIPDSHKFQIHHIVELTGAEDYLLLMWKTGANGSDNTDTHIGTALGYSDTADATTVGTAAVVGEMLGVSTGGLVAVVNEVLGTSTGGADVFPAAAHIPIRSSPTPVVKANGTPLVLTTDYTIVLATGVVTLVLGQTSSGDQITISYTYGVAQNLQAAAHIPVLSSPTPVVKKNGTTTMTLTTDYTINLTSGVVTLVAGQTTSGDVITINYSYTSNTALSPLVAANAVGSTVTWSAKTDLVVKAGGTKYYDLPDGTVLRFKADVGEVELTFFGPVEYSDPQPLGRFNE